MFNDCICQIVQGSELVTETDDDGLFQLLPREIALKIFSYLAVEELCRCAQVSKVSGR